MERTQEYLDRRVLEAKHDMITVMKELEYLKAVKKSPNYKKYGIYIDVVNDNAIMLKASAFSQSDPRNLSEAESKKLINILRSSLSRKKQELENIINA